ncbi:hypothetical protein DFQ28_002652 [Apophysomyces sp. BC1034]|nr:hypothetical protein DFQ30_003232 [Apophysomyces sp. BC1015]KAG0179657.1 hypothetical protein DFQ29_001825 [Apophysomyces sp. BC1021]KAG0189986.1 hypothetical protein DFQ28_002652 [Apophysomyces sp. BC1034]
MPSNIRILMAQKYVRTIAIVCVLLLLFVWISDLSTLRNQNADTTGVWLRSASVLRDISSASTSLTKEIEWCDENDISHQLTADIVLSKSFSAAGSNYISPYYLKAHNEVLAQDITITTLVTRDRIPNLARLAARYKGPISATVHIPDDDEGRETVKLLNEAFASHPEMRQYVDIHLVRNRLDRQLNMWRNVAKLFARSDYIMMLDIDFYPCTNFRQSILSNPSALDLLRSGQSALVIPAFEYTKQDDGLDWRTFPTNKSSLVSLFKAGNVGMFHSFWVLGHGPTDYDKWISSDDLYEVTTYQKSYEPYIVVRKDHPSWCDERFVGYGSNKAACLYELYISGVDYYVLPHDFIIHQTHAYPDRIRDAERKYNRRLYNTFREEICVRYARQFIAEGAWESPKAMNLKEECPKVPKFRSTMRNFV